MTQMEMRSIVGHAVLYGQELDAGRLSHSEFMHAIRNLTCYAVELFIRDECRADAGDNVVRFPIEVRQ